MSDVGDKGSEDKVAKLAALLSDELGAEIADLKRLSAGASRETWAFTAGGERRILQRSRFAPSTGTGVDEPILLRHAHAGGVMVPEIVAASSTGDHPIGGQFTISSHIDGESIARKILRDDEFAVARECFVDDCARGLAAIHALDVEPVRGAVPEIADPVEAQRATYKLVGDPHPVFDLAFRWLDDHRPAPVEPRLVHGDFRMGNFLLGPDGMTAVLDWELAHLGNPVEDLGWLVARAWRFGGAGDVGGLGTRERLLAAYEATTGFAVSPDDLRWWEVLASLRWGVITMFMGGRASQRHQPQRRTGGDRSSGRRNRIRRDVAPSARASRCGMTEPAPRTNWPHDVPDARELVEAVRDFLADDLGPRADGRDRFLLRVAANALSIAARELASLPEEAEAHAARLEALGAESEQALSDMIEAGSLDDRRSELADALWETTLAKLAVANPSYRDESLEP